MTLVYKRNVLFLLVRKSKYIFTKIYLYEFVKINVLKKIGRTGGRLASSYGTVICVWKIST